MSHAVWVALCAAGLVVQTSLLLVIPLDIHLIVFVFFATLCSYNFHYLLGNVFGGHKLSLRLFYSFPTTIFFLLAGGLGVLLSFTTSHIRLQTVVVAFILTILYSLPLLPFRQLAVLRKAGFVKTVLLAFTWMFVTAYLPMSQHDLQFTILGSLLLIKRFFFMLMLCIVFDNRDAAVDKIRGLSSLATDLSPAAMKWLIYGLFVLLFLLNFLLGNYGISLKQRIALQLASISTLVVYFYSTEKQDYFFYYFLVDGMMFLSAVLVTLASI